MKAFEATAAILPAVSIAVQFPIGSRIKAKNAPGSSVLIRGRETREPGNYFLLHAKTKRVMFVSSARSILANYELAEGEGDL
jgi:hypothetical protein